MEALTADGSASLPDPAKRRRARPWSKGEEVTLIEEVLGKEELLFGELKGPNVKSIGRKRADAWAGIAAKLSSKSVEAKREVEEVKKKYFNLKQRAKEKIDQQRRWRGQTGGGPALPQLSAAEDALVGSMEGRPVLAGLGCGVDTDAIAQVMDLVEDSSVEEAQEMADRNQMMEKGNDAVTSKHTGQCDNRKRKSTANQHEETLKNTRLDSERIILEQDKLKLEIEKLKSDISCNQVQENTFRSIKTMAETINLYYQQKLSINLLDTVSEFS